MRSILEGRPDVVLHDHARHGSPYVPTSPAREASPSRNLPGRTFYLRWSARRRSGDASAGDPAIGLHVVSAVRPHHDLPVVTPLIADCARSPPGSGFPRLVVPIPSVGRPRDSGSGPALPVTGVVPGTVDTRTVIAP